MNDEQDRLSVKASEAAIRNTDLGNARRLVEQQRGKIRYCPEWKRWLIWTSSSRWIIDTDGEIQRLAKRTVQNMYWQAEHGLDDDERKNLLRWALSSESAKRLRDMVALAKTERGVAVHPVELDANPFLLGVHNGVIDLRTGKRREPNPDDLITKLAPVVHVRDAACPTWLKFLDTIMGGDPALIGFLQRAIGYSLTGDTREQCTFILHGIGRNGKSTLMIVIEALLGDYAKSTQPETLMVKRYGAGIPCEVASLKGARLVSAVEADQGRRLSESLIKQLSGGDRITARHLYANPFTFLPEFKMWLTTNHRPVIMGTDLAIWRRIRLIPFEVVIPEAAQDRQLADKLKAELPGILNWAIDGCLEWQSQGLASPAAVTDATGRYRAEMDRLAEFLDDRCVCGDGLRVATGPMYDAYTAWCAHAGEESMSLARLTDGLAERGFVRTDRKGGGRRYFLGIGLKESDARDDGDDRAGLL